MAYETLSSGELTESGKHVVYSIPAGKTVENIYITLVNLGSSLNIIGVYTNNGSMVKDGEKAISPGYNGDNYYEGLSADSFVNGNTLLLDLGSNGNIRYTVVGEISNV